MSKTTDRDSTTDKSDKAELIYQIQLTCLNLDRVELARCSSLADCKLVSRSATTATLTKFSTEKLVTILQRFLELKAGRENALKSE